ncbi:succinate dehydrogenase assembly factor 3, mitochondrial [Cylas formicarius]|uniref:succinate dehydrogenase assembly factor 3, mitochondrial n=1 Tax=Cylas formicarius TaxID=197179 RepID=UPI002958A5D3|nr:succinate dehydrogenase assembly factor 3, mitochondrial [Cylas formicarius]
MALTHTQGVKILYKLILRLNRGLPEELQLIGSTYVRDEFRRHKDCKPHEADIFMTEWTNYAVNLAKQLGIKGVESAHKLGADLPPNLLNNLRDEQIVQLYKLMEAAGGELDEERT